MLLNNECAINDSKEEIRRYLETNENENTTTPNQWDIVKAVLGGKFIALQAYFKKQEDSQINNLTLHIKELEKEQQTKPKMTTRNKIINIRAEINNKLESKIISTKDQ